MLISFAKNISRLLGHLIFPPLCIGCLANHRAKANDFCLPCFVDLPYTDFHLLEDNQLKRRFYGKVELKYALALFHFVENSIIQQMIHRLKYKNRTDIGVKLGQIYAEKIKETDLHRQFDIIIPVPLHDQKFAKRGYNQCTYFGLGLSEILEIPLEEKELNRTKNTDTQTEKNANDRRQNMKQAFSLSGKMDLRNKHILLIDDVVTTGATIESCAKTLKQIPGVTISLCFIAAAKYHL